jgi:hypothetical protein
MLLPDDNVIRREGIKCCVEAALEFFMIAFPQIMRDKEIVIDEEVMYTLYMLASSDDEYMNMLAKQWGINLGAEAINLPPLQELLEKGEQLNAD